MTATDPDPSLPDVRTIPLAEFLAGNDTALARAVRRLAGEVAKPQDVLAAFTSYVE